jgi:hypothetical protein
LLSGRSTVTDELEIDVTTPRSNWNVSKPFFVAISTSPWTDLRSTWRAFWRGPEAFAEAFVDELCVPLLAAGDAAAGLVDPVRAKDTPATLPAANTPIPVTRSALCHIPLALIAFIGCICSPWIKLLRGVSPA